MYCTFIPKTYMMNVYVTLTLWNDKCLIDIGKFIGATYIHTQSYKCAYISLFECDNVIKQYSCTVASHQEPHHPKIINHVLLPTYILYIYGKIYALYMKDMNMIYSYEIDILYMSIYETVQVSNMSNLYSIPIYSSLYVQCINFTINFPTGINKVIFIYLCGYTIHVQILHLCVGWEKSQWLLRVTQHPRHGLISWRTSVPLASIAGSIMRLSLARSHRKKPKSVRFHAKFCVCNSPGRLRIVTAHFSTQPRLKFRDQQDFLPEEQRNFMCNI